MHRGILFTAAIALLWPGGLMSAPTSGAEIRAAFDGDFRRLQVIAPGFESFRAGFSATVDVNGTRKVLRSTDGVPAKALANAKENTPYGVADMTAAAVDFPQEQLALEVRLGPIPGVPGVLLQPVLHNKGKTPVRLVALAALDMPDASAGSGDALQMRITGTAGDWTVTALDQSEAEQPLYASSLDALGKGTSICEYGGLYRKDGTGFLFGPVGEPIAYLNHRIVFGGNGHVAFSLSSDMSGVRVDPGESRAGQQAVLLFEAPRLALTRWADWVAKTHGSRTGKGALAGWCSWYHLTSHIKGSDVLGVVDAVKKQPDRLRPSVIQIDDGYQDFDGKWDANAKFPEGMAYYARRIAETGARPGLWMAMTMIGVKHPWLQDAANREAVWGNKFKLDSQFRPDQTGWLDPTHPRAKAHIAERIRHAVSNGFTYLKLDFNNIGGGGWYEQKKTSFQILREHYANMRAAAGEDTYILFCDQQPNRAVLGLVDATRTSHDAHRGGVRSAANDVLRSYHLNGRWMAVDNDCYYLAPDVAEIGAVQGGWDLHRTWISMMGLSCGAAITSDPWHWDVLQPRLRTVEIMQPPAKERTEVLDLCLDKEWPRLSGLVKRPWGQWAVALLWNPGNAAKTVTLELAQAGLDSNREYAVWSFWDNQYLGTTKGSWTTPKLAPNACQHLVFTPIAANQPALIGSNLHIYCGAAEIKGFQPSPTGIKIELTDAGARDGELFIHSKRRLVAGQTSDCAIAEVAPAGENVWKVKIQGRQSHKTQSISLAFDR